MYYSDYNRQWDEMEVIELDFSEPAPPPPKKKRTWPRILALLLACALVGGGAGVGGALLTNRLSPASPPPAAGETVIYEGGGTPVVVEMSKIDEGKVLTAPEVYASNVHSVVGIRTQITTNVWGQPVAKAASGSGFVLTADGYILTNHHVIEDATSITVSFKDGTEYEAKIVGSEAENDIAVLKVEAAGLTPVRLGTSSDLVVGEDVVAIGNPLGELTFSMTRGIVSALDRTITMSDGTAINVLQTDCAINSGSSGGPLFDMYGQVVGITNAKYSNNGSTSASIEGISFAIPIDDVKDMVREIMEHGYVTGKPYVGVTVSTAEAQQGRPAGAYVYSVVEGAAADRAGLKKGDIITAVDGETIQNHREFIQIKDTHKAGDTVALTVDREGKTLTVSLTFDERTPDNSTGAVQLPQEEGEDGGQDGGKEEAPPADRDSGRNGYDDFFRYFFPFGGWGW